MDMNKEKWEIKKLGEVCDLKNGFAFKSSDYIPFSNTMNFRMSQIRVGGNVDLGNDPKYLPDSFANIYREYLLEEGDLVIAMTDMAKEIKILGVPTIVPQDNRNLLLNQRVGKLTNIDKSKIDVNFLKYALTTKSVSNYYKSLGRGGLQINLGKQEILKVSIPIPPLSTQEKIVSELDTLHRLKELQEQQLAEYDNLAQSTFYSMFGDPIENEKGWEVKKLGEVCDVTNGKNQRKIENPNGKFPIYGSGGIMSYANDYLCPAGTVIIGRKGTINRPILVKQKIWIVDTAFGFVPKKDFIESQYLYFFCKLFDFMKLNVAVTIPSLRKVDLVEIETPIPPISLQNTFANRIERIEVQKELVKQGIVQTQLLIDYTMDKYFG